MYKSEAVGKGNITARVVECSVNEVGDVITTMEIEYLRISHSQMLTHSLHAMNSSSSRAIPTHKAIQHVKDNLAMPIYWGTKKAGMVAGEEHENVDACQAAWKHMAEATCEMVEALDEQGLHKQIAARPLEPYQMIRVVVTATEWDNFFWLRLEDDTQPETTEIARVMKEAQDQVEPVKLKSGEWHLPYIRSEWDDEGTRHYYSGEREVTLEEAKQISVSCCAQVSYRNLDDSIEKATRIFDMLVGSKRMHSSAFAHTAQALEYPRFDSNLTFLDIIEQEGMTHVGKDLRVWSGKLVGFAQYRQFFKNNTYWGEK